MESRILCVCKGNTCRSPMMEGMLTNLLRKSGINNVKVESAGTIEGKNGRPINEKSAAALERRGINLSSHSSKFVGDLPLHTYNTILCVGEEEASFVLSITNHESVIVLSEDKGGIPNPYQQSAEVYEDTAKAIESGLVDLLDKIF